MKGNPICQRHQLEYIPAAGCSECRRLVEAYKDGKSPCHDRPFTFWCDREGLGGFMGHTCMPSTPLKDRVEKAFHSAQNAYRCSSCEFVGRTFNELVEHGQQKHGEKAIDPGNEFSSPSTKKLAGVLEWVRRQPDANLKTGEGKLLVDEIDRLVKELEMVKMVHASDQKVEHIPSEYEIRQALWQVFAHSEFDQLEIPLDDWTGNDHPQLIELAKSLWNRWESFPDTHEEESIDT
jgi:hypothetical protein